MFRFGALAFLAALTSDVTFAKDESHGLRNPRRLTECKAMEFSSGVYQLFFNAGGEEYVAALKQIEDDQMTVGSITELIPEAADASVDDAPVEDGKSGDTDFPHGNLKPLATVGEVNTCGETEGEMVVGVPDGMGAYLIDDKTVRVVVQSESYGPIEEYESYPFPVNDGAATFTGSHVQYADVDREGLAKFMEHDKPASGFVKGFGEVIKHSYNLKNEPVGPRSPDGPTTVGAHYSNTDAEGNYVVVRKPSEADWVMQSLCSAHLELHHNWGNGIGLEDTMFLTNEEWMIYAEDTMFVGISAHAIDLENSVDYAVGAFTQSGFEKAVDINPTHKDFVFIAISGYNGAYDNFTKVLDARNAEYGPRPDGKDWVWTRDIVPTRVYIGVKGKMEDGGDAPKDDFLARNGLRYGKVYGYAIDMSDEGPTKGMWRDTFHLDPDMAHNGAHVPGKWFPIDWQWNGTVTDYHHDGAWDFQVKPPGAKDTPYLFWNSLGNDEPGCKMEHISPDPRLDKTAYIQGSTCGYFGHYYMHNVAKALAAIDDEDFPHSIDGSYYVYQGELSIVDQIELGGKGQYADGLDATKNYADNLTVRETFEDLDGLNMFMSKDGHLRAIIQEDSGNDYGERMFITSPLEHEEDGNELTYYLIALSGGRNNTRMTAGVGIPAGTNTKAGTHEFSGAFDLSGLLRRSDDGDFALKPSDPGSVMRKQAAQVALEDKYIMLGLQAHNLFSGVIDVFRGDRGGQWLIYQPENLD